MKSITALLCLSFLFLGCQKDDSKKSEKATGPDQQVLSITAANVVSVIDSAQNPIVGARVLVGDGVGAPFKGNYLITDANGRAVVPAEWLDTAHVTVEADGFVRVTYLNQNPSSLRIELKRKNIGALPKVSGVATGIPVTNGDNQIDFALVMPAFTRQEIFGFDINKVISPENDTITVMGETIEIPSNVSLPKQKESYFLPITLEKPAYRVSFASLGAQKIFAGRGRFPFKQVVDEMRGGKDFGSLINYFKITGGSLRDVTLTGPNLNFDIPTGDLSFAPAVAYKAPAVGRDEMVIGVTANEINGAIVPTDFRKLNSGESTQLSAIPNQPALVASVLKKTNEMAPDKPGATRISVVLSDASLVSNQQFLPLIEDPKVVNGQLVLPKISTVGGIGQVGTYIVMSEVTVDETAKKKIVNPMWEVYGASWINNISLPAWPLQFQANSSKRRWDVSYIGSQNTSIESVGIKAYENATHVTHSAAEF